MVNRIHQTDRMPQDFKTSMVIPVPKKAVAKKCTEHRTISLMSHTLKLLLAIEAPRIKGE